MQTDRLTAILARATPPRWSMGRRGRGAGDGPRLGVALGRHGTAVVVLALAGDRTPVVENLAWLPTPEPASGQDRPGRRSLRATIGTALESRYPVHALLAPRAYRLTLLDAPPGPEREHVRSIRWSLATYLKEPIEQMAIGVFPMAGPADAGGRRRRLGVVSIPRTELRQQRDQLLELGLNLKSIGIPPLALRNISLHAIPAGGNHALVSIGPDHVLFNAHSGDHLVLSRQWPTEGIVPEANAPFNPLPRNRLATELVRSLDFCTRRGFRLERVLVFAPGGERFRQLCDDTRRAAPGVASPEPLRLDRIPGIHWNAPVTAATLTGDAAASGLHAIGAALRGLPAPATAGGSPS